MIRATLAVACALALLALSAPAIDDARTERAEAGIESDLQRLDRAASDLIDAEMPRSDVPGPRRAITVHVPERSLTIAGVEYVLLGTDPPQEYVYKLEDGPPRQRSAAVSLATATGNPIALSEPGRHRLVLTLVRRDNGRAVVISEHRRPTD